MTHPLARAVLGLSFVAALVAGCAGQATSQIVPPAASADPSREVLAPNDGWAAAEGGTRGGADALPQHVYTVRDRAGLVAALAPGAAPRIVRIAARIDLSVDDAGRRLGYEDYRDPAFDPAAFERAYDPATWGRKPPEGPQEDARARSSKRQSERVLLRVPSRTTLIGVTPDAGVVNGSLMLDRVDNVIVRRLHLSDAYDHFPVWDPKDNASGEWNSEYDNITLRQATHVWIDHCTFDDGARPDHLEPLVFGRRVQHHDGLLDITRASDFVTVSWNHFRRHDKTTLVGGSDNHAGDEGRLRVTFHHNFYDQVRERTPRVRFGQVHVYNNLFAGRRDAPYAPAYSIGVGHASRVFSENNVWETSADMATGSLVRLLRGTAFFDRGSLHNGRPADLVNAVRAANPQAALSDDVGWKPVLAGAIDEAKDVAARVRAGAGATRASAWLDDAIGAIEHKGWTTTRGGAGGAILKVTHLGADGPGSLKAAIDASGPRIVVFEVGGVIDMAGKPLDVRNPYITIAGQTAPSPGITITRAETSVLTHDVIVQHLRFRPGEFGRTKKGGGDQDGLSTRGGAHDVIVDHCSFSWGTDENLSASGPRFEGKTPDDWRRGTSHRITYSRNLIYEGLSNSVHEKGEHSKGSLIHDNTTGVLLLANVYISNRERNALFKGGAHGAMVNNVIFNPGRRGAHYNLLANEWVGHPYLTGRLSLVGNVMRYGPDTETGTAFFTLRGDGDVELFMHDNVATDRELQPVAATHDMTRGKARMLPLATADLPTGLVVRPAASIESALVGSVGARPWDRDALDRQVLADMSTGRGRIIDSETQNALGYPAHQATRRAFDADDWNLDDMSPRLGWGAAEAPATSARTTVILVGDSTMAARTGYGPAFCRLLEPALACVNLARGGRSTLSFRAEGLWDQVLAHARHRPGPVYLLIQFGHNDQPGKVGRQTDLATEYPANLARYVSEARTAGLHPVLVTPLTRRSFREGRLDDHLEPWAESMRAVARALHVPLVDLHASSTAAVAAMGSQRADELAMALPGHVDFDRTHVGQRGACVFAALVSGELAKRVPELNRPRSAAQDCAHLPPNTPNA